MEYIKIDPPEPPEETCETCGSWEECPDGCGWGWCAKVKGFTFCTNPCEADE